MDTGTSGPVQKQDISVELMARISSTLAGLVQDLLGPGGQQTLLSTSTGKVMVSRDGLTILSSLHLDHPVAHVILQSLRSHSSHHHDGSKTFILYLSQILKDIARHVDHGKSEQRAMSRLKLSVALNRFLCSDFQHVVKLVVDRVKTCSKKRCEEDDVSVVRDVLKGSLQTCLQKQMVPFFTEYLVSFLSFENQGANAFQCQLDHILQHFDMYHSKVTTQPLQKSKVCEGILLEADLQRICQGKVEDGVILSKRFALMDVNFDESKSGRGGNVVSVHLTSDRMETFFSQKRASLEKALKSLKSVGVHILLCADTVPQFMQGLCRENGIVIQCLPREKLMFLSDLTGVPVLTDLSEVAPTRCFFEGRISGVVQMGRKICTLINIKSAPFLQTKHLVVCSPTEGMCDQLCHSLFKALKAVKECHQSSLWARGDMDGYSLEDVDSNGDQTQRISKCEDASSFTESASTVNCGGAFEAVLINAITDYFSTRNCHPAEQVNILIQKMLVSVPQILHANLCAERFSEKRRFTEKWTHMLSMARRDHLLGLGGRGAVMNVDCIEPVASKLGIVAGVLQLVVQLLRLEAVVPVKTLLSVPCSSRIGDSDDDDDDDDKEHDN